MAGDVKVDSLELLRQYQGHFRNFADCVDAGIVVYRDRMKSQKEELLRDKANLDNRASRVLDKIDYRLSRLDDLDRRFEFSPQDRDRIELERQRMSAQRSSLEARIEDAKEKIERQIGILDDILNLTYSYGNKTREMANSANGSLTQIIGTLSNYREK
ncbi:MAG: hypothetical protein NC453_11435 [Muribaculum sp.]|nr:hypothetical protein [Muribaculum sp.]